MCGLTLKHVQQVPCPLHKAGYLLESQYLPIVSGRLLHLTNHALSMSDMLILKSFIEVKEFTVLICMA